MSEPTLEIRPVTRDRWDDLARLFGASGAYANCWCTWWRRKGSEFDRGIEQGGAGNRALMAGLVASGAEPGLIAYRDGEPVAWVSVAPRPQFGRVLRSPGIFTGTLDMFRRPGSRRSSAGEGTRSSSGAPSDSGVHAAYP